MNFDCGPVSVWLNPDGDCICTEGQSFEPQVREVWSTLVSHGKWAIDIGAHTGLYAIAAAKLGAIAMAVEPQPFFAQRILSNAKANKVSLTVIEAAASDHEGREFFAGSGKDTDGIYNPAVDKPEWIWTTVKTVRLDYVVPRDAVVSAIKIDVERHEMQVLDGCRGIIEACRPKFIIEALDEKARDQVICFFTGYQHTLLDDRNLLLVPRA